MRLTLRTEHYSCFHISVDKTKASNGRFVFSAGSTLARHSLSQFVNVFKSVSRFVLVLYTLIGFCYSTSHFITLMERAHPWARRSPHPARDNLGNSAPSTDTRARLRLSDHDPHRRTTERA